MTGSLTGDFDAWVDKQSRFSALTMAEAISATHLVKNRTGFGQKIVPVLGSVLASPVPASYDPDPDYFFHWFRDSAVVIDALRVALLTGNIDGAAIRKFQEFIEFSLSLQQIDGHKFLKENDFRTVVLPHFLQFLRTDADIASVSGASVLADTRVNPDGTVDIISWPRPQADGPAMRLVAVLRWWQLPDLDANLRAAMVRLIEIDIDFCLSRAALPSFDIWEEECGFHYYTQLIQREALEQGGQWLAARGADPRIQQCRDAALKLSDQLESYWDPHAGFYRSRTAIAEGIPEKALDIAVILAAIHAGRAGGDHSILDPKVQATLIALEKLFEADYAINRQAPAGCGPAMGRYVDDKYYSGGAYYFSTLAAAEFYFALALALFNGAEMPVTAENQAFLERLNVVGAVNSQSLAHAAMARGNAILAMVRRYTPENGALSEQFDRTNGGQTSAKHLAWSYGAFVTAAACRQRALSASAV